VKELIRTPLGRIAVEPKVLERLVRDAAASVDGARVVRPGRALTLTLDDSGVAEVSVALAAARGIVLPELAGLVQRRVSEALEAALGAPPASVDVVIEAIDTDGAR